MGTANFVNTVLAPGAVQCTSDCGDNTVVWIIFGIMVAMIIAMVLQSR